MTRLPREPGPIVEANVPMPVLQDLMGHPAPSTTMTRISGAGAKQFDAVDRAFD